MSYYILIRGPLGCGKTTIASKLAKEIDGVHIAIDSYIEEHNLYRDKEEGYISQKSFIRANKLIEPRAKRLLGSGKVVILEGNFYWKSQIEDLIRRLNCPYYVFTLKAPLTLCIQRDSKRNRSYGSAVAKIIYKKVMSFECGRSIDATDSQSKIIKNITSFLPLTKLRDIASKKPFNLNITSIFPVSSHNAMSGQSFHVIAGGKHYKMRYCENIGSAKEMERNIRLLPEAFPHFYGREGNILLSAWVKGKEPSKNLPVKLCYQLGKMMGKAHALNSVRPNTDLESYFIKKVKIIENAGILTKMQLKKAMNVFRKLEKEINYQRVIEFQDVHVNNLLVTPNGKLLFVDEDGFNNSIRGSGFAKPIMRFGWLRTKKQKESFWKGYNEHYNKNFFTQAYDDFISIAYALKTIAYRYVRGTDYSKEKIRLLDILKNY